MGERATPRRTPCASCPYRANAPRGLWHEDEYQKLPRYDEPTWAQPTEVFLCHQGAGQVCAGWLGFGDPSELLAVRIGIIDGRLDLSCADYSTDVPLHPSGTAAAEHGRGAPEPRAIAAAEKLSRLRGLDEHGNLGALV